MSEEQKPLATLADSLEEARPVNLDESELFVAGQWQLMWWRFRRHKLALIATSVVLFFYLICLMPEFLSVHEPRSEESTRAYIPPQGIHFFDGWKPQLPYVYGLKGERNLLPWRPPQRILGFLAKSDSAEHNRRRAVRRQLDAFDLLIRPRILPVE